MNSHIAQPKRNKIRALIRLAGIEITNLTWNKYQPVLLINDEADIIAYEDFDPYDYTFTSFWTRIYDLSIVINFTKISDKGESVFIDHDYYFQIFDFSELVGEIF